jgi:hypothetical protein
MGFTGTRLLLLFAAAILLSADPVGAAKPGEGKSPLIISAIPDLDAGTVVIAGRNLHGLDDLGNAIDPHVTLNGETLFVVTYSLERIDAQLSAGPWTYGSYLLTVAHDPAGKDSTHFDLTIGGDITEVAAGPGLAGGGSEGPVSLEANFAGSGSATTMSRSDHDHDGGAIVSGVVGEVFLDASIARDDEVPALAAATTWSLSGNAGTVGGVHFLGTTDTQPFEIRVGGWPALRLEPHASLLTSVIMGYRHNSATGFFGATVSGGGENGYANTVTNHFGTVGGGRGNEAGASATVGGGQENIARGLNDTISGGAGNQTSGHPNGTIGGGTANWASNAQATTGGGAYNSAAGIGSTVAGGRRNGAYGWASAVPGGEDNAANGDWSFAAGRRAKASQGSFIWADSNDFDAASVAPNSFTARAIGGVRFVSAIDPTTGVPTAGVDLPAGAGAWSTLSDARLKRNVIVEDPVVVLGKLSEIPIASWNYQTESDTIRHIGPSAQDFYRAFGLGGDDTRISTVDADGVALAAIKGLQVLLSEKEAELQRLETRLATLELLVESLDRKP